MKQLIYTSVGVGDLVETALHVLERAAVFNLSRKITGLLAVDHRSFAQVLEGRRGDVDKLMASIAKDPRHTQVRVIADFPTTVRMWPTWQMSIATTTPRNLPLLQRYGIGPNGKSLADLEPALLKALLLEFSEHAISRREIAPSELASH
jgi:hypothetical protein